MGFHRTTTLCAASKLALIPAACSLLCLTACSEDGGPTGPTHAEADSTWTVMVYDAADGSAVPIFGYFHEIPTAHSGAYVNLIGLQDTVDDGAKILYIDDNNDLVVLEQLGELSTGAEETLYDFVTYAKENYPADRYIMCFYGHGAAWFGCCGDQTNRDSLRMHEIKAALSGAGGVDLVFFTAPCMLGCVEAAYELRDCADIFIASEGMSGFCYWTYPVERMFAEMDENPTMSNDELAELVIEEMWNGWEPTGPTGPDTTLTMCALRTKGMERLRDAIDKVAVAYVKDPSKFRTRIAEVFGDLTRFESYVVDLNSLVSNLLAVETDFAMRWKLTAISRITCEAMIAECHSPNWGDVGGLSIFLPPNDFQWMSYYLGGEDIELDFVKDTRWGELASLLVEGAAAQGLVTESRPPYLQDGNVRRFTN